MENVSFTIALAIVLGFYVVLLVILTLIKRFRKWISKLPETIGPDGSEDENGFHRRKR